MSGLQAEVGDNDRVVFSVTIKYTYETTGAKLQEYYGTRNLREAAEIDRQNLLDCPEYITEDLLDNGRGYTLDITPIRISDVG